MLSVELSNWKSQIRKGLIELVLLNMIDRYGSLYGLEILDKMKGIGLEITEGTLYPLLNRLVREHLLSPQWKTNGQSGNPRKYYKLTPQGVSFLKLMNAEWNKISYSVEHLAGGTRELRRENPKENQ